VPDSPTPFEVSCEAIGGARVVRVSGELDIDTHEKFADQLVREAEQGAVVVDLTACEFIDSTGIRALLLGIRAAGGEDVARIAIAGPNQQVRRILEMTGLDTAVPVHASVDDAVAAVGSA
jgi:anti-sigma B factor antagonist